MKTTLALFAAPLLAISTLHAQDGPKEGQELLDLFERMHRDGATEADLRNLLENKTLLDLKIPDERPDRDRGPRRLRVQDASPGVIEFEDDISPDGPRKLDAPAIAQSRPMIGILVLPLDPALRGHFGLEKGVGVLVERALENGPAAKKGIRKSDIIVSANGKAIGSLEDLVKVVESVTVGQPDVDLEIIQKGQRLKVTVPVQFPPAPAEKQDPSIEAPALNRPLVELSRRLDRQQREIEKLRREIEKLKRQNSKDNE